MELPSVVNPGELSDRLAVAEWESKFPKLIGRVDAVCPDWDDVSLAVVMKCIDPFELVMLQSQNIDWESIETAWDLRWHWQEARSQEIYDGCI